MFEAIFIEVLNLSYIGSIVILAVLMARLLLKKAPKRYTYILWSVVLLRLLLPFSFASALSLLPVNPKPIPTDLSVAETPQIITGIAAVDVPINNALPTPEVVASVNPLQIFFMIASVIWVIGMSALLLYGVISYIKLKHRLKEVTIDKDNLFISNKVLTPFVLGFIKPKIYLPVNLDEIEKKHILLHEQTHIRRFDHVIRFVSYLILSIHWFNPLVWVAFYVSGKDNCIKQAESQLKSCYEANDIDQLIPATTMDFYQAVYDHPKAFKNYYSCFLDENGNPLFAEVLQNWEDVYYGDY